MRSDIFREIEEVEARLSFASPRQVGKLLRRLARLRKQMQKQGLS